MTIYIKSNILRAKTLQVFNQNNPHADNSEIKAVTCTESD